MAFLIAVFPHLVRAGSLLARFITQNPRIFGTIVTSAMLSEVIKETFKNEEEQREFIREMDEKYPGFAKEYSNPTGIFSFVNVENIFFIFIVLIIIYLFFKKK